MYKKSGVRGVPKGEERLIDAKALGRHIKYAATLANFPSGAALARAMQDLGCECNYHQMSDWQRGVAVPSLTAFFTILALTGPPGGLKFFADAWPDLWLLIERGLNGQPAPREEGEGS